MKKLQKALIGLAALAVLGFGTSALAAPQYYTFDLFDIYGNQIVVKTGFCETSGNGGSC